MTSTITPRRGISRPGEETSMRSPRCPGCSFAGMSYSSSAREVGGVDQVAVERGRKGVELGRHVDAVDAVERTGDLCGLAIEHQLEVLRFGVGDAHLPPHVAGAAT